MKLAAVHNAWSRSAKIHGAKIGAGSDNDGYDIEVYRASTGRITIRCYYWHHEQDISREGYLLDHRVSGASLGIALSRAREAGYPRAALMEAVSTAEDHLDQEGRK